MGRASVTCGSRAVVHTGLGGGRPEVDHCENLGVYGKMILKTYLRVRSGMKRAVDNEQKRKNWGQHKFAFKDHS